MESNQPENQENQQESQEAKEVEETEKIRLLNEELETMKLIETERSQGLSKPCPFCGCDNALMSGCNYVTCMYVISPNRLNVVKDEEDKKIITVCPGGFNGKGEWCWQCHKPKYQPDPSKVEAGCCNDPSHNSH